MPSVTDLALRQYGDAVIAETRRLIQATTRIIASAKADREQIALQAESDRLNAPFLGSTGRVRLP